MAAHTVTNADRDMAGTFINIGSDTSDFKPQPVSRSVVKHLSDMRRDVKRALADLSAGTKIGAKVIV